MTKSTYHREMVHTFTTPVRLLIVNCGQMANTPTIGNDCDYGKGNSGLLQGQISKEGVTVQPFTDPEVQYLRSSTYEGIRSTGL